MNKVKCLTDFKFGGRINRWVVKEYKKGEEYSFEDCAELNALIDGYKFILSSEVESKGSSEKLKSKHKALMGCAKSTASKTVKVGSNIIKRIKRAGIQVYIKGKRVSDKLRRR